jgi:hypothetical protein
MNKIIVPKKFKSGWVLCDKCGSSNRIESKKKQNNRQRMRISNKRIREWLLENNYNDIWFKAHTKRNDRVYTQSGTYLATDLWNLFDGICFDVKRDIVFLQMKTNAWPKEEPIKKWVSQNCYKVLVLNCTNKLRESKGKWMIKVRDYS